MIHEFFILFLLISYSFSIEQIQITKQLPTYKQNTMRISTIKQKLNIMQNFTHSLEGFQKSQIQTKQCRIQDSHIQIQKDIDLGIKQQTKQSYLYSQKHQIVYRLTPTKIYAYKYKSSSINFRFVAELPVQHLDCEKQMLMSPDQQFIFMFSCKSIYRIQVKSTLTKMKKIMNISRSFDGFKTLYANDLIIWLNSNQKSKILKQNSENQLEIVGELQNWQITDAKYQNNKLYLLSRQNYIYILQKNNEDDEFQIIKKIELESQPDIQNFGLQVSNNSVFIYSIQSGNQYITQLFIDSANIYFVRYYKHFHNLLNMQIVNKRLLIATQKSIIINQINKDPRKIKSSMSGIEFHHFDQLLGFQKLFNHTYIQILPNSIHCVQMVPKKQKLICNFKNTGSYQFKISHPCPDQDQQEFYNGCIQNLQVQLIIMDPNSRMHFLAIFTVYSFCGLVIMFMIAWRKGKIQIIQKLVDEVNKLASQNNQDVEFVQQSGSKQSQWNDIKDLAQAQFHPQENQQNQIQGVVETQRHMK